MDCIGYDCATGRVQSVQPCWSCIHAVPDKRGHGCPWSREFKPVPGWTATREMKGRIKTYRIEHCPQYEDEAPAPVVRKKHVTRPERKCKELSEVLKYWQREGM